jgi:uncharacterized protein (DUF58 family)
MTTTLRWTASHFARRLVLLAGFAITLAFALARPELAALAAVPALWLAVATRRHEPANIEAYFDYPNRGAEGEPIPVQVAVDLPVPVDLIRLTLTPGPGLRTAAAAYTQAAQTNRATLDCTLVAGRWGRYEVGHIAVECWTRRRLRHALVVIKPHADIAIYPRPAALRRLPVTSVRHDRTGDHAAPAEGSGVEFHAVRRYVSSDRPKRINWPVTTRRGQLYVTTTRAERAVDVILALDVLTDTGPPGNSSRDLALRGATGLAQTILRTHDRVGLVALGGRVLWLRPDHTTRQFYRIAEAVLNVVDWESYLEPNVDTVPYTALPAGARVIYFSPLVDERGVEAARILQTRGHPVTVINVCAHAPNARAGYERLALRLWRLDRDATRNQLASLGITVTEWDGEVSLDAVLSVVRKPAGVAR